LFGLSPRNWNTLSPITAARSVTSFTGLPRRADSSPSRCGAPPLPTSSSLRARSEKMLLANLCNHACCQLQAPIGSTNSRASGFRRRNLRSVCSPRYPHSRTNREAQTRHVASVHLQRPVARPGSPIAEKPGELKPTRPRVAERLVPPPRAVSDSDVPSWTNPGWVDRAAMARSKFARAYSAQREPVKTVH